MKTRSNITSFQVVKSRAAVPIDAGNCAQHSEQPARHHGFHVMSGYTMPKGVFHNMSYKNTAVEDSQAQGWVACNVYRAIRKPPG